MIMMILMMLMAIFTSAVTLIRVIVIMITLVPSTDLPPGITTCDIRSTGPSLSSNAIWQFMKHMKGEIQHERINKAAQI